VPLYVGFLLFFIQLLRLRRSQWIIAKSKWFKNRMSKSSDKNNVDTEGWIFKTKERLFNISFVNLTVTIISLLIVTAGLADLAENYLSYAVLEKYLSEIPPWEIRGISYAAMVKWFLIALVTGALSLIFWRRGWWKVFTFVFLIAAVIGFAGLFNHELFKTFIWSQIVILPVVGILFIILQKNFVKD